MDYLKNEIEFNSGKLIIEKNIMQLLLINKAKINSNYID